MDNPIKFAINILYKTPPASRNMYEYLYVQKNLSFLEQHG